MARLKARLGANKPHHTNDSSCARFPEASVLPKTLENSVFCALDVETSGLKLRSRVVEVGAVLFDCNGERDRFHTLVNPCEEIESGARSIHGITDEMVRGAPCFFEVIPGLLQFVSDSVFVAHNATFDVTVLTIEFSRVRLEPPDIPVICTVLLARSAIKGPNNYRLKTLVDYLRIPVERLHRGLEDALAAMNVFLRAVDGIPGDTPIDMLPGFSGSFRKGALTTLPETSGKLDASALPDLADARVPIEMLYRGSCFYPQTVVTPIRVFNRGGRQYLLGYCHRDGIMKTYRTDRIERIERLNLMQELPSG